MSDLKPKAEVNSAVDKFRRRLIQTVSRYLQENKPLEQLWPTMKGSTFDCEQLWTRMRALTLKKITRLLPAEDQTENVTKVARMTPTDWLMFDLILVHEDIDLITTDNKKGDQKIPKVLHQLFGLVQKFELEDPDKAIAPEAWASATTQYNKNGYKYASPMLLQKRWYQLKMSTRTKFCDFWLAYRGNEVNIEKAREVAPNLLEQAIAKRYPHIITKDYPTWKELVGKGKIAMLEEFESRYQKLREPSNTDDPDIILLEPELETVVLDDQDSENDEIEKKCENAESIVTFDETNIAIETNELGESIEMNVPIEEDIPALVDLHDTDVDLHDTEKEIDITIKKEILDVEYDPLDIAEVPIPLNDVPKQEIDMEYEEETNVDLFNDASMSPNKQSSFTIVEEVNIIDDEVERTDDEVKRTDVEAKINDDEVKRTDEAKITDDEVKRTDDKVEITDDEVKITDDEPKITDDETNRNDEEVKKTDEVERTDHEVTRIDDEYSPIKVEETEFVKTEILNSENNDLFTESITTANLEFVDDGIEIIEDDFDDIQVMETENVTTGQSYEFDSNEYDSNCVKEETNPEEQLQDNECEAESFEEFNQAKFDLKLLMLPVVYTTNLDKMTVLKHFIKNETINVKNILEEIVSESKPVSRKSVNLRNDIDVFVENEKEFQSDDDKNANDIIKLSQVDDVNKEGCRKEICEYLPMDMKISKLHLSNPLFQKPRAREYSTVQLCKNPDFNTKLKRLSVGFCTLARNRQFLKLCQPVTIDLHKSFEYNLVDGGILLDTTGTSESQTKVEKNVQFSSITPSAMPAQCLVDKETINLDELLQNVGGQFKPDRNETNDERTLLVERRKKKVDLHDIITVKRINKHLLTAEISPMRVQDSSGLSAIPQNISPIQSLHNSYVGSNPPGVPQIQEQTVTSMSITPQDVSQLQVPNSLDIYSKSQDVLPSQIENTVDMFTKIQNVFSLQAQDCADATEKSQNVSSSLAQIYANTSDKPQNIPLSQVQNCGNTIEKPQNIPLLPIESSVAKSKESQVNCAKNGSSSLEKKNKVPKQRKPPIIVPWSVGHYRPTNTLLDGNLAMDSLNKMFYALGCGDLPVKKTKPVAQNKTVARTDGNDEKFDEPKTSSPLTSIVGEKIAGKKIAEKIKKTSTLVKRNPRKPRRKYCCFFSEYAIKSNGSYISGIRPHRCKITCTCCCRVLYPTVKIPQGYLKGLDNCVNLYEHGQNSEKIDVRDIENTNHAEMKHNDNENTDISECIVLSDDETDISPKKPNFRVIAASCPRNQNITHADKTKTKIINLNSVLASKEDGNGHSKCENILNSKNVFLFENNISDYKSFISSSNRSAVPLLINDENKHIESSSKTAKGTKIYSLRVDNDGEGMQVHLSPEDTTATLSSEDNQSVNNSDNTNVQNILSYKIDDSNNGPILPNGVHLVLLPNNEIMPYTEHGCEFSTKELDNIKYIVSFAQNQFNSFNSTETDVPQTSNSDSCEKSLSDEINTSANDQSLNSATNFDGGLISGVEVTQSRDNSLDIAGHSIISQDVSEIEKENSTEIKQLITSTSSDRNPSTTVTDTVIVIDELEESIEERNNVEIVKDANSLPIAKNTNSIVADECNAIDKSNSDATENDEGEKHNETPITSRSLLKVKQFATLSESFLGERENASPRISSKNSILSDLMEMSGISSNDIFTSPEKQPSTYTTETISLSESTTNTNELYLNEFDTSISPNKLTAYRVVRTYKDPSNKIVKVISQTSAPPLRKIKNPVRQASYRVNVGPVPLIESDDDSVEEIAPLPVVNRNKGNVKQYRRRKEQSQRIINLVLDKHMPSILNRTKLRNIKSITICDETMHLPPSTQLVLDKQKLKILKKSKAKIEAKIDLLDSDAPMEEEYLVDSSDSDSGSSQKQKRLRNIPKSERKRVKRKITYLDDSSDDEPLAKKVQRKNDPENSQESMIKCQNYGQKSNPNVQKELGENPVASTSTANCEISNDVQQLLSSEYESDDVMGSTSSYEQFHFTDNTTGDEGTDSEDRTLNSR